MQAACTAVPGVVKPPAATPEQADLLLRGVRFDRLVEGRVVASGTVRELSLQRLGGRFEAKHAEAKLTPDRRLRCDR